ncbi:hypothetical protein [Nocardioides sp.]|uniref:hypothetical protein n=1 Tax=Nocardioides sp. TaxID=35761 RepID=UPI002BFFADF6|nr:hypothetical protein [Nocardioides sp.]HSX66270.1 hypothetical protein [Nocardioides sp.]
MALVIALLVWSFALSALFDRRFTAWALRDAERGAGATARRVVCWHLRWLGGWLLVWLLAYMLAKNDPDNREAAAAVVPMILAYGPRALWFAAAAPQDFVEVGAEPEVARAVVRAGRLPARIGWAISVIAIAATFMG